MKCRFVYAAWLALLRLPYQRCWQKLRKQTDISQESYSPGNNVECVARDCNCQITFVHIFSQTLFRCHSQLAWSHCPTFRERVMFAIFLAKAIFYIYCQFYYPSLRQSYSAEKSFGPSAVQFAASLYPFAGKLELMSFLSVAPSQKRALKMAGKGGRAALSPLPLSSPSSFRDKK